MQGKGVIKFFAILLAVVCLYQLSFTWVAHKVENDAKAYSKGNLEKEKAYLDSVSTLPVYPVLGHTYQYCVDRELALGLDLKGGMNVTMQISLRELVTTLSNNSADVAFNQALTNAQARSVTEQKDYITLFVDEYEKLAPNAKLASIFANSSNQDKLKYNSSNSDVEAYLKDQANTAVQQSYTVLHTRIDQFGVTQPNIQLQKSTNRILIELPGVKEPERVRKLLSGTAKLEFYQTFDNSEVYGLLNNINGIIAAKNKAAKKDTAVAKADTAKATKTAALAPKDSTAAAKQANSLINKLKNNTAKDSAGLNNKSQLADQAPLFAVLAPMVYQGQDGQAQLAPGPIVGRAAQKDTAKVNNYLHSADIKSVIPQNLKFLWGVKPEKGTKIFELYAIKLSGAENGPVLQGDVINDARADVDQQKGGFEVTMYMNSQGAQKWKTVTAEASAGTNKRAIAIVLDDNVYSAPNVQNEISGGVSSISGGNFTQEDTKDLANILKAGRLLAPVHIIGEAVVGPSLGQEAISAGLLSCILGLVVILIFMVAYYKRAGTVAVIAVLINVFFLMGVLVSIRAVLTLPGIAGIILILGVAVDANVLVYERVREELGLGKSIRIAVADGFKHALPSILDANISTFLTGVILFLFGSGPIQGFATTLMIGIVTTLFCSLLISRLIFEYMLEKGWDITFSRPWSSHTFKNANYGFVKNRFKFYAFSGIFIVAGLISMATQGFNYGVDFGGGHTYVVKFNQPVTTEQVHEAVDATLGRGTEVKTYGTDKISINTNYLIDDNSANADDKVQTALIKALSANPATKIDDKNILSHQKVEATIANEVKASAKWTIILAIIVISAYILIRFRKWQFSLGAMVATAHDSLLVLSFFSIFKDILPFSLDIDQAFIAALLTVIGYSINDTVVVFDRIREFLDHHHAKTDDPKEVINHAINNTLSRTIITAFTVVLILVILFIFGGDVIRGFSFALLIGVIFGTYSSICVATPVIIDFGKKDLK
ncbi:protein translocase subunit SecDF [Mucilaginibacter phyllosphaerae]|uniref:Multifunctional fusion protein n=1 Tax=Mucilaginibacter phyllosphaerae TaxID=1812349 RepID=A0A4Y8A8F0_9SPHI|nr:protein translocase subunit SecDF [Mucilaginibacter phyllosphaerae]MBB3970641.1 SecD/SecF fusion protein [Mucilaginibacter phyllosphaerae]TEW64646.1 protein translocase subunit SecDF [Mucilaginibacter phyllosphaerae]GGH20005.1 protein translocase subunit SecDF [Mucilaginibacter phyllosphaerae]